MQAAQLLKYDRQFKLVVNDIPMPETQCHEILVQVKAAAVNPLDRLIGTGSVRLIQDYKRPVTMGNELAGVVTAVGSAVTQFQAGDRVYTRLPLTKIGAFAEYVTIDQAAVALMPAHLDFAQAAAVPLTGLTAYQALHEELKAKAGESVLIPGGSGSFGQLAIPIAKQMGLTVLVSGNARGEASAKALGADQYFDYRKTNYWEQVQAVDNVIDTLGAAELPHELATLKAGGTVLSLKAGPNRQFAQDHQFSAWKRGLFSLVGRKLDRQAQQQNKHYRFMFVRSDGEQLRSVTDIVTGKQLVPAIEPTVFKLKDINAALDLVGSGHPKGKVIIRF